MWQKDYNIFIIFNLQLVHCVVRARQVFVVIYFLGQ